MLVCNSARHRSYAIIRQSLFRVELALPRWAGEGFKLIMLSAVWADGATAGV
jgi:hypothetical protein